MHRCLTMNNSNAIINKKDGIQYKVKGSIMFSEKRCAKRYLITEQVTVRFEDDSFLNGTECSDISLGGMCVVLDERIEKKQKYGIIMMVHKYGDEVVMFESRFVRLWDRPVFVDRNDTRMGIKFIDLDPKNFDSLCRIIDIQSDTEHKERV